MFWLFYDTGRARLIRTRLIRSSTLFEVSLKSLPDSYHLMFKCTVNLNAVNLYFHLIQKKYLLANDFELTVPDL